MLLCCRCCGRCRCSRCCRCCLGGRRLLGLLLLGGLLLCRGRGFSLRRSRRRGLLLCNCNAEAECEHQCRDDCHEFLHKCNITSFPVVFLRVSFSMSFMKFRLNTLGKSIRAYMVCQVTVPTCHIPVLIRYVLDKAEPRSATYSLTLHGVNKYYAASFMQRRENPFTTGACPL